MLAVQHGEVSETNPEPHHKVQQHGREHGIADDLDADYVGDQACSQNHDPERASIGIHSEPCLSG